MALLVAGLALGPAAAARAGAAPPPPPVLTSTTVVSASGNAMTPVVELAQPMRVPTWVGGSTGHVPVPDIKVSDPEHFAAILLVAQRGLPREPALVVVGLPEGSTTRYVYTWVGYVAPGYATDSNFMFNPVLPAGPYRIYVIASGPEVITWHLPAPPGTRRLAASIPEIAHSVLALAPGVGDTIVAPVVWATGQFALPHPAGILLNFDWTQGSGAPVPEEDYCLTYDPGMLADAAASVPPPVCPGGLALTGEYGSLSIPPPLNSLLDYDGYGFGWTETYVGGTWGVKQATAFAGVAHSNGIRLLWLDVG